MILRPLSGQLLSLSNLVGAFSLMIPGLGKKLGLQRTPKPLERFRIILINSRTLEIHPAKVVLCLG